MAKEQRGNLRREDAVENFMMDDSSSDDNVENYLPNGGNLLYPTVNNTHQGLANLHSAPCVIIWSSYDIYTLSFLQRSRRIELISSPRKATLWMRFLTLPTMNFLSNTQERCIFFFLEHAGELRIIALVEEKESYIDPNTPTPTPPHLPYFLRRNHLFLNVQRPSGLKLKAPVSKDRPFAPAIHHQWASSLARLKTVLGAAPLKTQSFRCFQMLQAPRIMI